ncbi:HlyD family type I secretion periplasmic adaptor subunit [Pseudoduganella sp. UC29_106]|jgi:HlyD family secretion protein|uniref:HlyD family type I secretion periplasmic adaptor subunit n=1 Tax=Pseudoduganella sp. UC29_106 TaxID=3374553 RepID=UPI00375838F6
MEPANKPPVSQVAVRRKKQPDVEFLPDADEIELRPLPAFARITLPVLAAALLIAILWSSFSQVDQVVVARGRLINPLPNIVVQPLENSIVQTVDVRVGQIVRKGEKLATMDPTFTEADEAQLRTRLASLDTQLGQLQAELSGGNSVQHGNSADSQLQSRLAAERRANFQAQSARIEENIAKLQASLETNKRDQQVLTARLKSAQEMETMQEKLVAQQYGARIKLLEARDKRLEVERDQLLANNREQEIKKDIASQQAEKSAFDKGWRQKAMEDMLVISRERADVAEQLAKADKRHQLVSLSAPADAVVLEIAKLSPGSIARGTEAFFTLVPLSAELEAEVQIDALDVGYIKKGDPVHVKVEAFPFQRHGSLDAKVRTVSEDAFRRDSASPSAPESYYLSRIALGNKPLKNMKPQSRLLPGMTISAEIVVGKRSVMSYLIWPLTKALDESIREP